MKDMLQYFEFVDSDTGQAYFTYHDTWKDAYVAYVREYIGELEEALTDACCELAVTLHQMKCSADSAHG